MDVRATSAVSNDSGAVDAATSLCRLSPLQTNIGRSISNMPQTNCQFGSGDPRRVDVGMIVLRKRMQELRMQETKYAPPQHWMKWEKEWSVTYASDICEFMGWLQNMLINRRPGHAIDVLVLISLSIPTFVLLLLQFFQFTAHWLWSF